MQNVLVFIAILIFENEGGVLKEDSTNFREDFQVDTNLTNLLLDDLKINNEKITFMFSDSNQEMNDGDKSLGNDLKDKDAKNETALKNIVTIGDKAIDNSRIKNLKDTYNSTYKDNIVIDGDKSMDNLLKNLEEAKNGTAVDNVEVGCPEGTAIGATGACVVISANNSAIPGTRRKLFVIEGCPTGFDRAEGLCLEIEE